MVVRGGGNFGGYGDVFCKDFWVFLGDSWISFFCYGRVECNPRSSVRLEGEFQAVSLVFDALISLERKGGKFSVFWGGARGILLSPLSG